MRHAAITLGRTFIRCIKASARTKVKTEVAQPNLELNDSIFPVLPITVVELSRPQQE